MREASPFQINTTHAHRASIYLYETRRIELSSNPGYLLVRPLFFPLFSPAILARRGCGTGENPRRYRFDIDFRAPREPLDSRRNNWRSAMLGNCRNHSGTKFIRFYQLGWSKKEVCSKELFYFRRFVGETWRWNSTRIASSRWGLLFKCVGFIKERERKGRRKRKREIRRES